MTKIDRIFGQYTWYYSGNLRAKFWNATWSIAGQDAHGRFAPPYSIAIPPQQTAVYTLELTHLLIVITIGMFSSLRIWLRKGFHVKTAGQFILTFGLQWCIRYIPQVMTLPHYNDVIMSAMASQIISSTIVYSTVYSRRRSKKTPKLCVTLLCEGKSAVTGEFSEQIASNAENVSIWWRHH